MNKKGFISMTLVYTFLVLFMFIMLAILRTYTEKNKFLQAINNQIDIDIATDNTNRVSVINKIIKQNSVTSDITAGVKYFKISNRSAGYNGFYYMDRLNSDDVLLDRTDENADGHTSRIYYFKGYITNNYVVFANKCFRMIRTNEDGSIRLLYNGAYNKNAENKCYTTDQISENPSLGHIGKYKFNSPGDLPNSDVFKKLNDWYYNTIVQDKSGDKENPSNTFYTDDISRQAVYCSKDSIELAPTYKEGVTDFSINDYNMKNTLSFTCSKEEDRYTFGDGKMLYPVGLVTAQDVVLAGGYLLVDGDEYRGGRPGVTNTDYYMYRGIDYWTMSSFDGSGKMLYVPGGTENNEDYGALKADNPDSEHAIIPVISIGPNVFIESGTGTSKNPYIIRK